MQRSLGKLCSDMLDSLPTSDTVVDIDIGTLGTFVSSQADLLLTFDPFDEPLITDTMERYPYVIADYNGTGLFYENMGSRDCSTMNSIVEYANQTLREQLMDENCHDSRPRPGAQRCAQPLPERINTIEVEVRRLCDILKMRHFSKINQLKVDAQGSDFAIIKDVVENCAHVSIETMKIECQVYGRTIPLYVADNDCTRIERYLKMKFPGVVIQWEMNVCWSAEYNLIVSNIHRPE